MKKILISIIIIAAIIGFYIVNKHVKLVDLSTIHVSAASSLSKSKVKIRRGEHSINRKSDLELFEDKNGDRTVYNGFQTGLLDTDYGENDFTVIYNDKYYFQFRHFLLNSRYQHSYNFFLYVQQDTIYIQADIKGSTPMRFTRPMHLISQAKYLLCNNPIDSSKFIYNMKELK